MRYFRDNLAIAPCYQVIADDGAKMRCLSCNKLDKPTNLIIILTPNNTVSVHHKACLDDDWIEAATEIPGQYSPD